MVCVLSSHTHHVTSHVTPCDCNPVTSYSCDHDTFLHSFLCSKSKRKSKVNINNDLAILPSYNRKKLFTEVGKSKDHYIIGCKWIFKHKLGPNS